MRRTAIPVAILLAVTAVGGSLAQTPPPKKLNKLTGSPAAIAEGRKLYLKYGCSGCHGVGGGGGMAPAVIDDEWAFGSDDETLFKLIKGRVPGQKMPTVFDDLPDDEVWKMLAYIRSKYAGDPSKVDW